MLRAGLFCNPLGRVRSNAIHCAHLLEFRVLFMEPENTAGSDHAVNVARDA